MTKRNVRVAQMKVNHIPPRCRKWRRAFLQGEGATSDQALDKLEIEVRALHDRSKEFICSNKIEIFDATREGPWLCAAVFHNESDNLTTITQHDLLELNK